MDYEKECKYWFDEAMKLRAQVEELQEERDRLKNSLHTEMREVERLRKAHRINY